MAERWQQAVEWLERPLEETIGLKRFAAQRSPDHPPESMVAAQARAVE